MAGDKSEHHYKNLKEMIDSPEYQRFIRLVRQGVREGVVDVYPPLPEVPETSLSRGD